MKLDDVAVKPMIYLSGPIEFSEDPDTWREKMFRKLHQKYDVVIPDPLKCPFKKTDPEYGSWVKKNFIMPDMSDVATCRHFFVYIDHAYSSGTYGELSCAAWLGKEIVCFLDDVKKEELPMWIIGCLADATFVDSIEDGIKYYKDKR